jgi:hypothetical protein
MTSPSGWHSFPLCGFIEAFFLMVVSFLLLVVGLWPHSRFCLLSSFHYFRCPAVWEVILGLFPIILYSYSVKNYSIGEDYISQTPLAANSVRVACEYGKKEVGLEVSIKWLKLGRLECKNVSREENAGTVRMLREILEVENNI